MISDDLIRKCAKNDASAQRELYKLLASKLFAVCLRYTKIRAEAEDWLQDAFVKIFLNIKKYNFEGSFEGWARRVTVNNILTELRKNKRWGNVFDVDDVIDEVKAEESATGKMEYDDMLSFIQQLPEGKRIIFNMHVIEGFSYKEISELLGISEVTCRAQVAKAKNILIELHKKHNKIKA